MINWFENNGTLNGTLIPPATPTPSIVDKLLQLNQIKQDIKVAIENKGGDLTDVDFGGYAEKIDEIETGGGTTGGYTVTFTFFNMPWFPRTRIKQANGNDFSINTIRSGDFHYDPVVFENVTYIQ